MRIPVRAIFASVAIVLSYGGFVLAFPNATRDLGLDMWNYFDEEEGLRQGQQREAELRADSERTLRRASLKATIVQDVIDGRMALADAAREYLAMNLTKPEIMTACRQWMRAATDLECCALQVMAGVRNKFHGNPSMGQATLQRLELELPLVRQAVPPPQDDAAATQ
jgi:hypothetical protein